MTAYIVRAAQAVTAKAKALVSKSALWALTQMLGVSIAFLCVAFNVYAAFIVAFKTTAMQNNGLLTITFAAGTLIGAYCTFKQITE